MRKTLNRVASIATSIAMVSTMLLTAAPVHAAPVTGITDTMSREATSATLVTHTLTFTTAAPENGNLDIVYTGFSALAFVSGTCPGGTIVNNGTTGNALHVTAAGCTAGANSIVFTGTNSATPGGSSQTFAGTFTGTGSFTVSLNSNDQIIVTATVAPTVTFQVTTDHTGANAVCSNGSSAISGDHTPATNGGVVEFGTLSPLSMASSDALRVGSSGIDGYAGGDYVAGTIVQHICTFVSTSSSTGYALTVASLNGGLFNAAAAQYINAAGAEVADATAAGLQTIAPGTEAYIMCGSTTDSPKIDTTTPAGSPLVRTAPFNPGVCDATSNQGGKLVTATQPIGGEAVGPVQESTADWLLKTTINATTGTGSYEK